MLHVMGCSSQVFVSRRLCGECLHNWYKKLLPLCEEENEFSVSVSLCDSGAHSLLCYLASIVERRYDDDACTEQPHLHIQAATDMKHAERRCCID